MMLFGTIFPSMGKEQLLVVVKMTIDSSMSLHVFPRRRHTRGRRVPNGPNSVHTSVVLSQLLQNKHDVPSYKTISH